MKKTVILIVFVLLALSLCACGGMPGEEAAGLYPDIIGDWGTDPFGESIVLSLRKDGTCTVLNDPGTWTLNKKLSHEGQVTLTAKTEHIAYSIQLERVQDGTDRDYDAVQLLIMDSKKKLEVYKDHVFTQSDHFIFADLALQAVPELADEWGSAYWYEESALTIREDGTCTFLRQPGKWCLSSRNATWPSIDILIKLDSGKQLRADFFLSDTPGSYMASLDIFDAQTGIPVYPVNFMSNISTPFVISRTKAPVAAEYAAPIIGSWTADGNTSNPVATFNEDGTCTIRGADGIWTLEYYNLHNYATNDYWELLALIDENEYVISFQAPGNNIHTMSIYNKGMEILPHSYVTKIP